MTYKYRILVDCRVPHFHNILKPVITTIQKILFTSMAVISFVYALFSIFRNSHHPSFFTIPCIPIEIDIETVITFPRSSVGRAFDF